MRLPPLLLWGSLTLGLPPTVAAQGDIRFGLGGGLTVPVRSYAGLADKGWLGTASLTFFPGASTSLGFRLDAIYARNTLSVSDWDQTQLGGTANLVFQFGARRSPNRFYVFGGGGYIRTQSTSPILGTVSTTDPALNTGAGISFGARAVALYCEARYITVSTAGTKPQYAPIVAGITFGGF
jgi:hypothetical protein